MTFMAGTPETTIDEDVPRGTRIFVASGTNVGLKRQQNEDAVLTLDEHEGSHVLLVLADGMGGHAGGQEASQTVITTLRDHWKAGGLDTQDGMRDAVLAADATIHDARPGSGSTVVLVTATPSQALVAHVGDSRAYLLREGALSQLTRDHSWVESQVRHGLIRPEDARTHPKRNVLLQAVGTGRQDAPDIRPVRLWPGDLIMACSDGLHGVVDDEQITQMLKKLESAGSSLDSVIGELIDATLHGGAPDNVTIALLHVV